MSVLQTDNKMPYINMNISKIRGLGLLRKIPYGDI